MDRILVVNLTRMGDVIQTSPLVDGLRRRHPRARIGLLVLQGFAGIARLVPGVDEVLCWDQDRSVGLLHDPRASLGARTAWHRERVRELRGDGWDLVVNLSHSRESAVLARLLARGEVRGIAVHDDGARRVDHDWAKYFFCVTGNRAVNHFNLVDVYRLAGDLGPREGTRLRLEAPREARDEALALLEGLPGAGPLVMLQSGASQESRRWPAEAFAATARRLHEACGARFLVVGGPSERELCARLASLLDPLPRLDLGGRTSLGALTALAAEADLLLTGDTGTLHVASAVGTPSVSLFIAVALPWETAPWLPGCVVLQPRIECSPCSHRVSCPHVMCRDWLAPETVAAACLARLAEDGLAPEPDPSWTKDPRVDVWRTLRDGAGLQDLRPLGRRPLEAESLVARAYRRLWLERLGERGCELPAFEEELAEWTAAFEEPDPAAAARVWRELRGGLERIASLAGEGLAWTARLESELAAGPDVEGLSAVLDGVRAVDGELFRLELSRPALRPLGVLFRFEREDLERDRELLELNGRMAAVYGELRARALRLAELAALAAAPCERTPA